MIRKMTVICVAGALGVFSTFAYANYVEHATKDGKPLGAVRSADVENAGVIAEGFKLSLKTEQARIKLDDALHLKASLFNLNRDNVSVLINPRLNFALDITRPDGTKSPLTKEGRIAQWTAKTFVSPRSGPTTSGSKFEEEMRNINTYFDMTQVGEYQLRVSRQVPSIADPKKMVTIYSNVVKITIEAPKKDDDEQKTTPEETQTAE